MGNTIKALSVYTIGVSILCALLFIFSTATPSFSSIFSYKHNADEALVSTDDNSAGVNTDSADGSSPAKEGTETNKQTSLYTEIPGVGVFFSNTLDLLISLTGNSKNRLQTLANHFPLVFPDLYKVLITL